MRVSPFLLSLAALSLCHFVPVPGYAQLKLMPSGETQLGFSPAWEQRLQAYASPDTQPDSTQWGQSLQGLSGLVSLPSARIAPAGSFDFGASLDADVAQAYARLSPVGWLELHAGYTAFDLPGVLSDNAGDGFDRLAGAKLRLLPEGRLRPEIAVGALDVVGNGEQSGEYLVASKRLGAHRLGAFEVTAGLGWGTLAGEGLWDNPLAHLDADFAQRDHRGQEGGAVKDLFAGEKISGFAGLAWDTPLDGLSLALEYDPRSYSATAYQDALDKDQDWNFELAYQYGDLRVEAAWMRGNTLAVNLSRRLDMNQVNARASLPAWPTGTKTNHSDPRQTAQAIRQDLEALGFGVRSVQRYGAQGLLVQLQNNTYHKANQAAKRAFRVLAQHTPASVTQFSLAFSKADVPLSYVSVARGQIETDQDFSLAQANFAAPQGYHQTSLYEKPPQGPSYEAGLGLGFLPVYGYANQWASGQIYVGADAQYHFSDATAMTLEGGWNLWNNFESLEVRSNSQLPPVRSRQAELIKTRNASFISRLTWDHRRALGPYTLGRVTAGYLEPGFAGLSAEVLHNPPSWPFALGAELAAVRQRYAGAEETWLPELGLADYETLTGHLSLYAPGPEIAALGLEDWDVALHAGRYLAQDWGATLELGKTFTSGLRLGAFVTRTTASAAEFGEGRFDKGLRLSMPLDWVSAKASTQRRDLVWRPILGDGGARLDIAERLYETQRWQNSWALTD